MLGYYEIASNDFGKFGRFGKNRSFLQKIQENI